MTKHPLVRLREIAMNRLSKTLSEHTLSHLLPMPLNVAKERTALPGHGARMVYFPTGKISINRRVKYHGPISFVQQN